MFVLVSQMTASLSKALYLYNVNITSYMKSNFHLLNAVFQVMFYNQGQVHLWLESDNFLGKMTKEFLINQDIA